MYKNKRQKRAASSNQSREISGYARCSTIEQSVEGVTLDAQEQRIRAFCIASNRTLNRFIRDEGQSGKSMARNGLSALLAEVSAQRIGTVIVLKLDRLTRSVHDLAELLALFAKADCALISVSENVDTSSASGRLLLNLLASVSQWEAEAISERTSIALRYKKSQGLVYGRTPFGFIRDGARLVRDPESQAVLREIQDMHMKHGMTLRAIARQLNEHGVRPSQGGTQWYASSVRSVLKSSTWL